MDPHRARTRLLVGYGDGIAPLLADPRYELIAGFDELTTAERRELDAAGPAFGDFTTAARWSRRHPEAAERLARLSRRSARGAIFLHRP